MSQVSLYVNIQDCFWLSEESPPTHRTPETGSSPISPETWEQWFTQWLENLNPNIPQAASYELSLRLTDDTEIQRLNAEYRSLDAPTDVLAFATLDVDCPPLPTDEAFSSESLYLGDIVISVETANQQAKKQGHSLKIELAWLASHGLLHLLGWDHPDPKALLAMLNQQVILLQAAGLEVNGAIIGNVNLAEYSPTVAVEEGKDL
ncbi:rRNA maturation RNase YbeY [Capilliphycus salinus ALCB114379]|uniref:rRNA maturation RNase YbeY n=1 Tax=Capilliphycus salinus TaxID=2768948 RepID=UPI0039A4810A